MVQTRESSAARAIAPAAAAAHSPRATSERPWMSAGRWRAFGRCRSLADQRIAPETGRPRATRQGALQPWHWRRSQKTALWRPACASSFSARARATLSDALDHQWGARWRQLCKDKKHRRGENPGPRRRRPTALYCDKAAAGYRALRPPTATTVWHPAGVPLDPLL